MVKDTRNPAVMAGFFVIKIIQAVDQGHLVLGAYDHKKVQYHQIACR